MTRDAVFFDLGGVVVDVESDRLILQVAQLLGRTFDEVHEQVFHQELLLPLELGRIKPERYYEGLKRSLGLSWTYEQFVRAWNGILSEKREVTTLLKRLRTRHKLLALSNTNVLHVDYLRRTMPALELFHDWVLSYETGLRKPDPEIYRLALQRAGVRPETAVYVDDRPELVEAGRSIGLTAIRFQDSRQLEQDLQAVGLNF
jgi:putative hydrolase of the HAD superfamily